jgi:MFS transporter, PAT family, beta-lactamase induction signal transducer AmpG
LTAPKPTLRQALADKRMLVILLMSFGSGLPFNLTSSTMQAWLADSHVAIQTIGIFGIVALPYLLKPLWAPLLDRYSPPLLGRRRGWIIIIQWCLALAIGAMAFSSPAERPLDMGIVALVVAFLSASQDIVVDAYRVDTIQPSERGLAAGASAWGYRSAAMIANYVVVYLASLIGWRYAYLMIAVLMATTTLATLWAPEPEVPGQAPRTLVDAVWKPLLDLYSRPYFLGFLAILLLYKVGDAFALSLYSAFMIKGMGFSLPQLASGKLDMTISTVIGVTLGGWAYLRLGMFRSLLIFGVCQALTNLMYMVLSVVGKQLWLMLLATSVDTMVGGMGQAAYVAFLVSLCNTNFSATQYAILSALSAVPRVVMTTVAGYVVASIGWSNFFVLTCATAIPGLIVSLLMRKPINDLAARDTAGAG